MLIKKEWGRGEIFYQQFKSGVWEIKEGRYIIVMEDDTERSWFNFKVLFADGSETWFCLKTDRGINFSGIQTVLDKPFWTSYGHTGRGSEMRHRSRRISREEVLRCMIPWMEAMDLSVVRLAAEGGPKLQWLVEPEELASST